MNERKLTKSELKKREDIIMNMKGNKRDLVKKYGKDAESVMYGRATNMAKKQSEGMNSDKLREMIKDSLKNPKSADLNKDGKLSDYEEKRGAAIEKNLDESSSSEEKRMAQMAIKKFAKYRGVSEEEARQDLIRAAKELGDLNEGVEDVIDPAEYGDIGVAYLKGFNKPHSLDLDQLETLGRKIVKQLYKGDFKAAKAKFLSENTLTENKQEAFDELQMIMEQLYELSDQAKMIFRNNFPGEYRRLDAYGALDFGTSSNRYDVTLEGALENLDMEDDDEDMMQEDLDLGHQDNEPHMLKADLYRIGKYAMELYQILDQFEGGSEEVDLPHWWQSKIIKSKDAIVGAKHYLDFEIKEPQIDAMVDVASEEEVIDENAIGINDKRLDDKQKSALDLAVRGDSSYSFGNNPYADDQLRYKYAVKMGFLEETIDKNEVEEDLFTPNEIGDEAIDSESASGAFEGVAKKLAKQIKEGTKKSLNEFTDNDFSGNALIANTKVPGRDELATFDYYFPDGVASRRNAIASLQAHDESPIKARMGRYAPMFVHVQYHEFEDESGEKYRVHQKQFYNSNFKDNDPTFNPGVTKLHLTKLDPSGDRDKEIEIGSILVKTEDYIKDLKKLNIIDRQS